MPHNDPNLPLPPQNTAPVQGDTTESPTPQPAAQTPSDEPVATTSTAQYQDASPNESSTPRYTANTSVYELLGHTEAPQIIRSSGNRPVINSVGNPDATVPPAATEYPPAAVTTQPAATTPSRGTRVAYARGWTSRPLEDRPPADPELVEAYNKAVENWEAVLRKDPDNKAEIEIANEAIKRAAEDVKSDQAAGAGVVGTGVTVAGGLVAIWHNTQSDKTATGANANGVPPRSSSQAAGQGKEDARQGFRLTPTGYPGEYTMTGNPTFPHPGTLPRRGQAQGQQPGGQSWSDAVVPRGNPFPYPLTAPPSVAQQLQNPQYGRDRTAYPAIRAGQLPAPALPTIG